MKPHKTLLIKIFVGLAALGVLVGIYFLNQSFKEEPKVEVAPDNVVVEDEVRQVRQEGTVDLRLPSESTGSANGTLAVRLYLPDEPRYPEGAPAVVWGGGGFEVKGIDHDLRDFPLDFVMVTFIYPGGVDEWSGLRSDGVYDWRGKTDLMAFRDVVLFTAGELSDENGKFISDYASYPVLSDNIGVIGVSNGGNTIVAMAAMFGEELNGYLRYLVQWETPVSSQLAARDFGRVWMKPSTKQGDYFNPRYEGFDQYEFEVDFSDLAYDSTQEYYQIFHDGNGDGKYNSVPVIGGVQSPDLNKDGELTMDEDFPLDFYPGGEDGEMRYYSRPVTKGLAEYDVFGDDWPEDIATVKKAIQFWDIREAVYLYDDVLAKIPDLEAMVLVGEKDHVQSAPDKCNIRQALYGWMENGVSWVQLNPSLTYLLKADPRLVGREDLPDLEPNKEPLDWNDVLSYAEPEEVEKAFYQLAGLWQMMDRAQN